MVKSPKQRKKLWQLEHRFHCSVIGACLSLAELRTLCRKAVIPIPETFSDYELHCFFVTAIAQPGKLAKTTHKYLDRKYATALRRARVLKDGKALCSFWQEARDAGDVAGPYWAAVTHPCADEGFLFHHFGDVHMLSHLQGARVRDDMARLAGLAQETEALRQTLTKLRERFRSRLAEKQARIDELQAQAECLPILRRRLQAAEHQLQNWRSGAAQARLERRMEAMKALCNRLATRCERLEAELADWRRRTESTETERERLAAQYDTEHKERLALEAPLWNLLANEEEPAEVVDLSGRQVLYVGGLRHQWPCLRKLVERQGGKLLTHDGGREDNRSYLNTLLGRADWVLCPLDQISHDAVQRIKRACRQRSKPCLLLSNAGLSAFVNGRRQLEHNHSRGASCLLMQAS